ncbi:MAG: MFS transporter [Alphaproteobacteria bacterium]|nr:MFS transporter [Alphaproteobacteria bacterium]MDE2013673.1 MFS transporter [Alphaproteobacteria bacterium]MDE2072703.1 MFS transporter [Alphaproteobacteria bacterium]MDE2350974.1 MFS transporter [Alphaproteobacteria bacterium]
MTTASPAPASTSRSQAALTTLLAVMFINLLGFGIVIPLLPFYGKSFNAPAWQIALVFSAYAVGAFFGEPFWGRLSDRIGRKPILISTVSGNCLCYIAMALAPNVYVAFLVRMLGGLTAGNGSVVQGYITDVTPAEDRAGRLSLLGAAYNVGFIVGPALGGLLAHPQAGHTGFQTPLFVCAGLSFTCVLALTLFVRESRQRMIEVEGADKPSRWAVAGAAFRHPMILRAMMVTLLAGCAFMGVESIFGLWTEARFGWGPRQVGEAFAIVGVVAATCQLFLVGPLSKRFGEARVLAYGMALTATCLLLQTFSIGAITTVPLLAAAAFGQSIAWPNVAAIISRNAEWQHQGQYLGLNNAVGSLARVVGPFVLGLAFSKLGVDWPFYLAGVIVIPAIWLAWSVRRR